MDAPIGSSCQVPTYRWRDADPVPFSHLKVPKRRPRTGTGKSKEVGTERGVAGWQHVNHVERVYSSVAIGGPLFFSVGLDSLAVSHHQTARPRVLVSLRLSSFVCRPRHFSFPFHLQQKKNIGGRDDGARLKSPKLELTRTETIGAQCLPSDKSGRPGVAQKRNGAHFALDARSVPSPAFLNIFSLSSKEISCPFLCVSASPPPEYK